MVRPAAVLADGAGGRRLELVAVALRRRRVTRPVTPRIVVMVVMVVTVVAVLALRRGRMELGEAAVVG
jgi:hypothetical protein